MLFLYIAIMSVRFSSQLMHEGKKEEVIVQLRRLFQEIEEENNRQLTELMKSFDQGKANTDAELQKMKGNLMSEEGKDRIRRLLDAHHNMVMSELAKLKEGIPGKILDQTPTPVL